MVGDERHPARIRASQNQDVSGQLAGSDLRAAVAEIRKIEIGEKGFASADENGRKRKVKLLEEAGAKELLDGR